MKPQKKFMELAIKEANNSKRKGDYAVGAVLIKNNKILAVCSNRSKRDESPIAHAETLAIIKGSKILKNRHLTGCILYTTHEPCPMCASAAIWARMKGIVFGATIEDMLKRRQENGKFTWRQITISCEYVLSKGEPKLELVQRFMQEECNALF